MNIKGRQKQDKIPQGVSRNRENFDSVPTENKFLLLTSSRYLLEASLLHRKTEAKKNPSIMI